MRIIRYYRAILRNWKEKIPLIEEPAIPFLQDSDVDPFTAVLPMQFRVGPPTNGTQPGPSNSNGSGTPVEITISAPS